MYEKLIAIEVENEEGETQIWTVKRLITQEPENLASVFSNELVFRPGGGAIARRVDNRVQTLADDSIADAHRRQREEWDKLGVAQAEARTGGERGIEPQGSQPGEDGEGDSGPGRRPRRGSRESAPAA